MEKYFLNDKGVTAAGAFVGTVTPSVCIQDYFGSKLRSYHKSMNFTR